MSEENEKVPIIQPGESYSSSIIPGRSRMLEPSPPISPAVYKVAVTPSSPTSNQVSSNEENSYLGTGEISQGSSRTKLLDPSVTPIDAAAGSTKFLYVKEKFRRPSFLSDMGCRTPKDGKSTNQRVGNLKKDLNVNAFAEQAFPSVPPNTPSPSGWRNPSSLDLFENNCDYRKNGSLCGSDASSQVTTKALASESESSPITKTSTETLLKMEKTKSKVPADSNFDSNYALSWSDHMNYLQATRSGHTGLRSVGSSAFMKSFWNNRSQKNIQHHCFMSDITDVRQMEQALLQLLEDFHSGKLRAFAKDCSMEQMQGIREQQERLARLHFDLGAQQDLFTPLSEEGLRANQENMQKLMGSLQQLSLSIEKLQLFSKDMNQ